MSFQSWQRSLKVTMFCRDVDIFRLEQYKQFLFSNQSFNKNIFYNSPSQRYQSFLLLLAFIRQLPIILIKMEAQNRDLPEIFLFVNATSGGGIGRQFLDLNVKQLQLEVAASQYPIDRDNKVNITLNIFDMTQPSIRNEGFTQLKKTLNQNKKAILVICGGDGTVMWVVSELNKFDIDHSKVPVAMLPLGTGNDFSQILGWGKECPSDLLKNDFAKLKKRVSYWMSAHEQSLDIWMVEASVHDYGKFEKVSQAETTLLPEKTFTKHFCNYFSVGVDGKIGYSFDLHRTSSRLGNLVVYGMMGVVKSFTKTKTVQQLTQQFKEIPEEQITINQIELKIGQVQQSPKPIKKPKEGQKIILTQGNQQMEAIKNNQNLLFLNINSFMGGVKDVWKNATLPEHLKEVKFKPESHQDGMIEVISFPGAWSLGFEKSIGGFGSKVYQGTGPYQFTFNKFPQAQKHRTYLQVDGQFIRYTHPKELTVRKSTLSRNSKMCVLKRVFIQLQRTCCC